ncbi:MAG: AMP nucleosidase [Alphaproteobacteria bacterium]|nr:AMP nucleosidase [Alphaproteobacteria bacterium]
MTSKKCKSFKPRSFKDPDKALAALIEIYEANRDYLKECFDVYCKDMCNKKKVSAYYPYVKIAPTQSKCSDSRFSYGFASKPGVYKTILTRPDLFDNYYREQFRLLIKNHNIPIEIGVSDTPMPIHFALGEDFYLERDLDEEAISILSTYFDVPDLDLMDDEIANCAFTPTESQPEKPLSLFLAPRVDLSLQRLKHYCGTNPKHFQKYVLFTNYQFYIDEFVKLSQDMMSETDDPDLKKQRCEYSSFVSPGDKVTLNKNIKNHEEKECCGVDIDRMPQMPAYHLKRANKSGITIVNIGVGPSNAKTITDHVAVLRPHAWIMLGHCAGLRNSQRLGDYVLAHGYLRDDGILDKFLPPSIPVPPLAEIQQALEQAVERITGNEGYDMKKVMRTGTVATVNDRNWEFHSHLVRDRRLSQSRAIALDMESGTIAANGLRFRVSYGTLLCVSDKPLHGQLKIPGMADSFYRQRVEQHLKIGVLAMELLRDFSLERLHSRKLRAFDEPAFQ